MAAYLYVGDQLRGTPPEGMVRGIGVYRMEADGSYTPVQRVPAMINSGAVIADSENARFYVTDEVSDNPCLGTSGGGRILFYEANRETGELTFREAALSYGGHPSYIAQNSAKDYMITTHFAPQPLIFKLRKNADGSFTPVPTPPDTTTVLRRIGEDGSLGLPTDVRYHEPDGTRPSHMHSVVKAPHCELFAACDIGLDLVYMFTIDEESGTLKTAGNTPVLQRPGCGSRYIVFHTEKPWMFVNAEHSPIVTAYRYTESGELTEIGTWDTLEGEPEAKPMASGIDMTPDGKHLYCATRGTNTITVFDICPECGELTRTQIYQMQGDKPRYCRVSPDGRYLLASNTMSNSVEVMAIGADGMLSPTEFSFTEPLPGTLDFMTF